MPSQQCGGQTAEPSKLEHSPQADEYGFRRVQGSLYVTDDENMANLFLAIQALRAKPWFPKSVRDIRAFRIEQGCLIIVRGTACHQARQDRQDCEREKAPHDPPDKKINNATRDTGSHSTSRRSWLTKSVQRTKCTDF